MSGNKPFVTRLFPESPEPCYKDSDRDSQRLWIEGNRIHAHPAKFDQGMWNSHDHRGPITGRIIHIHHTVSVDARFQSSNCDGLNSFQLVITSLILRKLVSAAQENFCHLLRTSCWSHPLKSFSIQSEDNFQLASISLRSLNFFFRSTSDLPLPGDELPL